jgi:ActR/RegA family two-component response regulator
VSQNKFETLDTVCALHVIHVLQSLHLNKSHTAKALGIGLRTLQRNLKRWEAEGKIVVPQLRKESTNEFQGL